jgi:hypothetical protein
MSESKEKDNAQLTHITAISALGDSRFPLFISRQNFGKKLPFILRRRIPLAPDLAKNFLSSDISVLLPETVKCNKKLEIKLFLAFISTFHSSLRKIVAFSSIWWLNLPSLTRWMRWCNCELAGEPAGFIAHQSAVGGLKKLVRRTQPQTIDELKSALISPGY